MKYFKSRGLASLRLEIAICSVRVHRNSPCAPRTSKYMRYVEQTSENNTREFHLVVSLSLSLSKGPLFFFFPAER